MEKREPLVRGQTGQERAEQERAEQERAEQERAERERVERERVESPQTEQERYMGLALDLAREAAEAGEVPVGCVVVRDGAVIGRGRNRREARQSTAAHAEMEAMAEANRAVGSWRLDGCELYVTLEPCPMCAGAVLNGRVRRVWYGARDTVMGACGGVLNLFMEDFPNPSAVVGGVREAECREVLSAFFDELRRADGAEPSGAHIDGTAEPSGAHTDGTAEPPGAHTDGTAEPPGAHTDGTAEPSGRTDKG